MQPCRLTQFYRLNGDTNLTSNWRKCYNLSLFPATGLDGAAVVLPSFSCFLVLATIWLTFMIYPSTLNFRLQPLKFMYLIFPNTGRSFQPCRKSAADKCEYKEVILWAKWTKVKFTNLKKILCKEWQAGNHVEIIDHLMRQ